eukprot:COSAG01_NODE_16231_length_1257_cov_1.122625_1_plen_37_part_10
MFVLALRPPVGFAGSAAGRAGCDGGRGLGGVMGLEPA